MKKITFRFKLAFNKKMKNSKAYIIDDEEDICLLLKANLSKKFKEVQYAKNLKEGLAYMNKNKVDVLFLDNNLPDGSGIEMIGKIRKANPAVIIIIISAMTNLRNEAIAAGARDFLGKPISFSVISELLKKFFPAGNTIPS